MAAERGEFSGAAAAGAGAGETGVARRGWAEREAEDGVSASLCGRDGDCRNRKGDRLERGYGEGASFARAGQGAGRSEGETMMSLDPKLTGTTRDLKGER